MVGPDNQKGDPSYFEHFKDGEAYFGATDDNIQEWYEKWLRRLLRLQKGTTVFKHMKRA